MREIFIDLGANKGNISLDYAMRHPKSDIYCIEPNSDLIPEIVAKGVRAKRTFITICAAAWTYDGEIEFFQSNAHEASTVVSNKVENSQWPQIDYSKPNSVPCFDFSRWMLRTFSLEDDIVLKMDIEGAEYDLLQKMIDDRSILLVRHLICEWHFDRFPDIGELKHSSIRSQVSKLTKLQDWV